jgi:hypothetical protein
MPRVLVHTRRAVEAYKPFGFKQEGLGLCPFRCATRCSPWRRSSRIRRGARARGRARSRKAGPLKRPSYRKKKKQATHEKEALTKSQQNPKLSLPAAALGKCCSQRRTSTNAKQPADKKRRRGEEEKEEKKGAAANVGGLPQTQGFLLMRKVAATGDLFTGT